MRLNMLEVLSIHNDVSYAVDVFYRLRGGRVFKCTWGSACAEPLDIAACRGGVQIACATRNRVAGLSFTLGFFLLTGFMSRVAGVLLALVSGWQIANLGWSVPPLALALIGVHLMLRGGGAWAMDIYVQKMQDRARQKLS